jgi:hypothetical protein
MANKDRFKFSKSGFIVATFFALTFLTTVRAEEPRDGRIEFSDGRVVEGKISLTPGGELKIQAGSQMRVLDLARVREIRLAPEKEEMDRNWRFKEAGQTAKEYFGEPYPVRYLQATAVLAAGESFTGHLYSTVFYVEGGEAAQKVLLLAKQRGNEGQSLQSLVYPARISFGGATVADSATATLRLPWPGLEPRSEIAALTRVALVALTPTPAGPAGEFKMTSPAGKEFFLAIKTGARIVAGWPAEKDEQALAQVQKAMANSEDFFDERRVLGVVRGKGRRVRTPFEGRAPNWKKAIVTLKKDDKISLT